MALTVNTNTTAMMASSYLNKNQSMLSRSLGRISSGSRINRAGDDAAGLGVAENLNAASRSLRVAMRNTMDGVSVVQIAEGSAAEVSNILKRLRELAVQSASDTLGTTERQYIQDETTALISEVDRIAAATEFNGVKLTNGNTTSIDVQVGIDNNTAVDRISITLGNLRASAIQISGLALDSAAGAQSALTTLDNALSTVNGVRSDLGAIQNRLESTYRNLDTYVQNIAAAESQIRDTDFAAEAAEMAKYQIMQQAGVAAVAQAKSINSQAVQLLQ